VRPNPPRRSWLTGSVPPQSHRSRLPDHRRGRRPPLTAVDDRTRVLGRGPTGCSEPWPLLAAPFRCVPEPPVCVPFARRSGGLLLERRGQSGTGRMTGGARQGLADLPFGAAVRSHRARGHLAVIASLVLAGLAGCGGGSGAADGTAGLMAAGQDCSTCHAFSVSGTVLDFLGKGAQGVTVAVGGLTLSTNEAGNFFSTATVEFPAPVELRAGGQVVPMVSLAPSGGCNGCHGKSEPAISLPGPAGSGASSAGSGRVSPARVRCGPHVGSVGRGRTGWNEPQCAHLAPERAAAHGECLGRLGAVPEVRLECRRESRTFVGH